MPTTHTAPPAPLRTGRTIQKAMHQVEPGDVLLWNNRWLLVQTITRNPAHPTPWLQVICHCLPLEDAHGATASGQECASVTVAPRAWVDHSRLPATA